MGSISTQHGASMCGFQYVVHILLLFSACDIIDEAEILVQISTRTLRRTGVSFVFLVELMLLHYVLLGRAKLFLQQSKQVSGAL